MTPLKRHRFITFLLLFACLSLSLSTGAQRRKRNSASGNDSLKVDSALVDTLSIDTVAPKKKQPLDAPVIYEANDSIVFTEGGYAHLYGDGKVNYEKIELTSAVITMNMDSSTVYARGVPDSVGVEKVLLSLRMARLRMSQKSCVIISSRRRGSLIISLLSRGKDTLPVRSRRKVLMMNFICVTDDILRVIITNILTSI